MVAAKKDIIIEQGATFTQPFYVGGTSANLALLTKSGSTVTATATYDHNLSTNDYVYINGANETAFNGAVQITSTGAKTFTFLNSATTSTTGSGTITFTKLTPLTGYSARAKIRPTYDSLNALVELSSGSGLTITAAEGKILMSISATSTASLDFTRAYWDMEIVSPSNEVTRILQGIATLVPEVTR